MALQTEEEDQAQVFNKDKHIGRTSGAVSEFRVLVHIWSSPLEGSVELRGGPRATGSFILAVRCPFEIDRTLRVKTVVL